MSILERATDLLELLAEQPGKPWVIADVALVSGIPAPTCSRLLRQLRDLGWVDQDGNRGAYRLGPRAFSLTRAQPYQAAVLDAARAAMHNLSKSWPQYGIVLTTLVEHGQHVLWECGAYTTTAPNEPIRWQAPWHSVNGRVLVANITSKERTKWITQVGLPTKEVWPGIIGRPELLAALREIRQQGFAEARHQQSKQQAIAAPIHHGTAELALGAYCSFSNAAAGLRKDLIATAELIRNNLV